MSILDKTKGIEICLNCPYSDCTIADDKICTPLRKVARSSRSAQVNNRLQSIEKILTVYSSVSTNQLKEEIAGLTNNHINWLVKTNRLDTVKVGSRLKIVGVNK